MKLPKWAFIGAAIAGVGAIFAGAKGVISGAPGLPTLPGLPQGANKMDFSRLVSYPVEMRSSSIIIPFLGHFSLGTYRKNYGWHTGLDFIGAGADRGLNDPVYAIADGVVIDSSPVLSPIGYGALVYLDHPQFGVRSRYAHLRGRNVKRGDVVRAGDVIGTIGTSGTDNVHLHFDMPLPTLPSPRFFPKPAGYSKQQVQTMFVNPLQWFASHNAKQLSDA